MKKVLITGSSGYVGGSFISLYKNIYEIETFSLLNGELNSISFNNIDTIIHCAAIVHQKKDPSFSLYNEINVEYSLELAKLAKKNKVKQFIFLSTIAVYGENEEILDENTNCSPVTPYGKSKLEAEKQLMELNDDSFVVSIIRPPMVYGKNAPGNIDSLVKLVKKVSIIPLGDINNIRSFVSIQNLCHMIDEIIIQKKIGLFLASDDDSLSTTRLIELISENLDKKVYLLRIPFFETLLKIVKPSFHKRLYGNLEVDNSITKRKLNLKNPYTVEEGIKFMIEGENS